MTRGADRPEFDDEANWTFYLQPGERLLGTWRPDDTFRPYGMGKTIMTATPVFVICLGLANLLSDWQDSARPVVLAGLAVLVLGLVLGLGPAKFDQINRRKRRYALSDRRVLEFQDITAGWLKSLAVSDRLMVAKIRNEQMESYEIGFAERSDTGDAPRTLHFQRLTEAQADEILATLGRQDVQVRAR